MKVVHNSFKKIRLTKGDDEDWRDIGEQYEREGSFYEAIQAYLNDLKINPLHENSYHRIMVMYRRQKDYKKEWDILQQAIAVFEKFYQPGAKKEVPAKIQRLSKALLKTTGLTDAKGKSVYAPEPLGKWYKRKQLLKKRIDSGRK